MLRSPALQVLNDQYSVELRHLIRQGDRSASDAEFISIDRLGADVRARFGTDYSVERVGFDQVRERLQGESCVWRGLPTHSEMRHSAPTAMHLCITCLHADRCNTYSQQHNISNAVFSSRLLQPVHTLEEAVASVGRLCAKFPDTDRAAAKAADAKPTAAADTATADQPDQTQTRKPPK